MTCPVQTSLEKTGRRPPVLSECQSDSSSDNIHELAAVTTPGCSTQNKAPNTQCKTQSRHTQKETQRDKKRQRTHRNIKRKGLHINQRDQCATGDDLERPSATKIAEGPGVPEGTCSQVQSFLQTHSKISVVKEKEEPTSAEAAKNKPKPRLRQNDYNPLMGGGGPGYRPTRRGGGG
ncbi:hypothetical protein FSP39_002542 [Pinctada imbricata]|uniref:Uncharacterized protein n=1 Tax=Pinctada imbricata TaxID=66713 RepID=A0AA89C301_PINIB|nr:hypothetical protein FSP39_002542 [Pinctada imbricata]